MHQKLHFLLFIFLTGSFGAFAQNGTVIKKDTVSKNTTTTIIITQENSSTYFPRKNADYKMAIKVNPLLALNGDLPVYFERVLSEKISIEVGAGPTVQNFVRNFWDKALEEDPEFDENRTYELGYSVMANLRIYPSNSSYALDGFYFAPELRHRVYNSTLIKVRESELADPMSRQTALTDYKIMFGKMEYLDDVIFVDYYLGTGIRKRSIETYDVTTDYNTNIDYITFDTKKSTGITFSLGVKVGFAF